MAVVGLKDLYMAEIDETSGVEVFATPQRLARVIKMELSVESMEETLYSDDMPDVTLKEFSKGKMKINTSDLEPSKVAALLGQKISDDGVIYAKENDDPPFVAIGFRSKKAGSNLYKYVWIYKVKFSIPSENFETKKEKVNFITPEIEGEFIKLKKNGAWKADYTGLETGDEVSGKWFDKVREYEKPTSKTNTK